MQLGQTEIANSRRVVRYMEHGVKNISAEVMTDDSWPGLATWLGREDDWILPELDEDCPWYDPSIPASAEFAGVWPMQVEGLDSTPLDRETIEGAVVGGSFGVDRIPPRVITVEAVLIARSPAGLRYGVEWLGSALRGSNCRDGGGPRRLQFLDSAPAMDDRMTPENIQLAGNAESRMVVDVVQTGALEIEESFGTWALEGHQPTGVRVSFELTAGVPYIWRTPLSLASGLRPADGVERTLRFENVDEYGNLARCDGQLTTLVDPEASPLVDIPRPVSANALAGTKPLVSRRSSWVLEGGRLPLWAETVPSVIIESGSQAERLIRLQWVEGVVDIDDDVTCQTIGEAMVGYVPPNSRMVLDALTGGATVITEDGLELNATPVVSGRWGGPWRPPVFACGNSYTLIIDSLVGVSGATRISIDGYVRQV